MKLLVKGMGRFCATLMLSVFSGTSISADDLGEDLCFEYQKSGEEIAAFSQQIADSIHHVSPCGDKEGCHRPANVRGSEFDAVVIRQPGKGLVKGLGQFLRNEIEAMEKLIGVDINIRQPRTSNYLVFVTISEADFEKQEDTYLNKIIAPMSPGNSNTLKALFKDWIGSGRGCMHAHPEYEDGVIRESQIWLRVNSTGELDRSCIRRSIYSSLGLKKPKPDSGNQVPADSEENYSISDDLKLAVLYSDLVSAGQTVEASVSKISDFIKKQCK